MQIFLFFALIISLLAVIFAVQNTAPVTVSFAIWKFPGSLALVLLAALAAGSLISFFASLPSNLRTRWALRQQRKKIADLENNLAAMRAQLEEAQQRLNPAPPASPSLAAPPTSDRLGSDKPGQG